MFIPQRVKGLNTQRKRIIMKDEKIRAQKSRHYLVIGLVIFSMSVITAFIGLITMVITVGLAVSIMFFIQGYKEGPDKVSRVPRFVNEDGSPIVESKRSPKPRVNKVEPKSRTGRRHSNVPESKWNLVIIFIIIAWLVRQFGIFPDSVF